MKCTVHKIEKMKQIILSLGSPPPHLLCKMSRRHFFLVLGQFAK